MEILKVLKANPYHDKRGRFTTGGSAHSVSEGEVSITKRLADRERDAQEAKFLNYENLDSEAGKDFARRLHNDAKPVIKAASEKQYQALRSYTGSAFRGMNKIVNSDGSLKELVEPELDYGDEYDRSLAEKSNLKRVQHVDAFMETSVATDNIIVYRAANLDRKGLPGIRGGENPNKLNWTLIGKEFFDPEIGSTSIRLASAESFMKDNRTMLEIRVRKGKKGVYFGENSLNPHENEFILARKTKYRIVGVTVRNGRRMLQVDAWD